LTLDEPQANETITKINGLDVLISEDARDWASRSRIDFQNDPYGEGFTISGPDFTRC
jgi:Fe-S cluster assembly iron-binding protein IscA